ncbi:MAG TPA: TonB-dependent receptor [Chitinophagaceae bacterium]|nr:TonB-dependent receptor [Chitinophagaceae bacterium]
MRKVYLLVLLALGLKGFTQTETAVSSSVNSGSEVALGSVTGNITTTDHKPAAYVSVVLKGTNKYSITDENGNFTLKNIKEGVYTLEISMVGLTALEKPVEIKKDQETIITIALEEDAQQLAAVTIVARRTLNDKPVSIGKISIDPMDLPQSIATISQTTIKNQQALRLSDIVKNVNGVYLTTTRGSVQENFAARGYAFSGTNLFKDGFRINSGVMPEVSSLEKIEILKGSAAILYGQVAPGGILNMVTKQPKFQFGGEVSMLAGSNDLYKPSFDIYGPVGSSIAYRVNGTFETANSFRDVVHYKRYYINPSLLFKLGQRTQLLVEGDYLKHNFTPDFGIGTVDNTKIPDLPRSKFLGTDWQYNTTQQTTTTVSLKHQFNSTWILDASTSYQLYKRDYYSTERIQAAANGDWVRPLGKINAQENFYAAQVNLTGKLRTRSIQHTLLAGVDGDRSFAINNDFSFPAVAGLPAGSYDQINVYDPKKFVARTDIPDATNIRRREAPINRFGVYAQDLIKLSSKFNLLAGVRWSYVQTVGIDSTNFLTGAKTKGTTRNDNAFSPRFGLVYKAAESTSLFASYASSFSVNTGTDIYGSSLPPSIIDQYEVGIKNDFFKGMVSVNLTLYHIVNNNLAQTALFDKDGNQNSNTSIKVLSGQTKSDGVELDVAAQPIAGLSVLAGYSYNNARYTKTDTTKGGFIEGEKLVNNPSNTANASIFYIFHKGSLRGFKFGATVLYIGDRLGGNNNTVGQTQTYSRLIPVDGYTVIDVSAGYTYKKISVMAKLSNITNTLNYYVHENYSINPLSPRQFVATVSYKL